MRFVRQYGDLPDEVDVDAVRDAVAPFPLSLVVVFGSYADDTPSPHALSDLDVAVEFEEGAVEDRPYELLDDLTAAIQRATGIEAVDIVDLEDVRPSVGYSALARGTLVAGDRGRAVEREAEFLLKALDFQPVKAEWDAALTQRVREGNFGRG